MNRGSKVQTTSSLIGMACFNEAPIHESGKCIRHDRYSQRHTASMRPRFMNRGSSNLTLATPEVNASLQ